MKGNPQEWSKWRETNMKYWDGTYRELNPFKPPIRCPECDASPNVERSRWVNPATSETQFMCDGGHTWSRHKTYD